MSLYATWPVTDTKLASVLARSHLAPLTHTPEIGTKVAVMDAYFRHRIATVVPLADYQGPPGTFRYEVTAAKLRYGCDHFAYSFDQGPGATVPALGFSQSSKRLPGDTGRSRAWCGAASLVKPGLYLPTVAEPPCVRYVCPDYNQRFVFGRHRCRPLVGAQIIDAVYGRGEVISVHDLADFCRELGDSMCAEISVAFRDYQGVRSFEWGFLEDRFWRVPS